MKKILAIVFATLALPTSAQNLTDMPELTVAQCYHGCLVASMTTFSHGVGRHSEYVLEDSEDYCRASQEAAFGVLACRKSCDDIAEIQLGDRNAATHLSARKALWHLHRRLTAEMRRADLWDADFGTPTIADADLSGWIESCARLLRNRVLINNRIEDLFRHVLPY